MLLFSIVSCDKLDTIPEGIITIKTEDDINFLLNSDKVTVFQTAYPIIQIGDNVQLVGEDDYGLPISQVNAYTWQDEWYHGNDPQMWSHHYASIFVYNSILNRINEYTELTDNLKTYKAEALFGRAFDYFFLANLYGKVYDESYNDNSPGIPYVESSTLDAKLPGRETLAKTYERIINDLEDAIDALPETNVNNARADKYAGYALMARVYYYMSKYELAGKYADLALEGNSFLNDPYQQLALSVSDKEVFYIRNLAGVILPTVYQLSDSFLEESFDSDPRINAIVSYPGSIMLSFSRANLNIGITVPEIMLIKAEVLAHDNKIDEAKTVLTSLISVKTANSTPIIEANSQSELIDFIYRERRLELFENGLRWFDMRKMFHEGLYHTPITRTYYGLTGTIGNNASDFVLKIPQGALLGTTWEQN